ncbi:Sensor histidine kinase RcsC [Dyadobacter sp. CECT 9275]|uniref:histidine kinase n=1 Tax=Dyadobacter helix TaxID=2822344 RepID=A0A916NMG6_9BACT|nr:ATP-binding protein [Dyadobacter sp. CECT 9275]CAG5006452.1 Sensor histidine kinase RcsC [Dyadobacter sp. CECT 9275]
MIRTRSFLFPLLSVLAVLITCGICLAGPDQKIAPPAKKGILDLRSVDLSQNSVPLEGEWKFYWKNFIKPGEKNSDFEYVKFPNLWKNITWKGKKLPSQGYASYELTILLPEKHPELALKLPDLYTSYILFVNGQPFEQNGVVGTRSEMSKPYWHTTVSPLLFNSDSLHLVLHVSNFAHARGGTYKNIELGPDRILQTDHFVGQSLDMFLTGGIFMGGLFFLGLYLFGRHDKSILYFSLFCLFYSYRIIGTSPYTLHTLLPSMDWALSLRFEYLSLYISVAMFSLYTRSLYPEDAPQQILSIITIICLAFGISTLVTPPLIFTWLINPFLYTIIFDIAFATYVYWRAFTHKRIGAAYAMLSTVSVFIIIISIILEYYGVAKPVKGSVFAGYLIFFFCQSLILSFKFATTLKKAKEEAEGGLKTKSEFLSTMSHEIRTPLNSVIGLTHLMLKEDPGPVQKSRLDVLLFSANNLLSIVNDILDFNTIEAGKIRFVKAPLDIVLVARNIVSGYEASADNGEVQFMTDLDPNIPSKILGDVTRISQVISNLVHNAAKFTNKGWVKLSMKIETQTETEVTIRISVEDTGIGIPPEKQVLIFERFTQVDSSASRGFSGTGLGLAISKRILELQGAELKLISEVDKGSTFYFSQTFTIVEPAEKQNSGQNENGYSKNLNGVHVLVVEDNRMNIFVIESFLKKWGAISDIAQNGKEALEKLDSSVHKVVLMDLHMPVMDGYEATRLLRQRGETLPIIALTASLALEVEEKVYAIGISDIVVKPFNPDELLEVIHRHI